MAGLTATGLSIPTMEELEESIRQAILLNISSSVDLSPEGPVGQLVTIVARQLHLLWLTLALVYGSVDRYKAEGVQLDNVGALTGCARDPARKSRVYCNMTLGNAVTVPAASIISNPSQPEIQFSLVTDVTSVGAGTYVGLFEAMTTGPVPANAGTLTNIVTPVTGWTAVTNPLDATLGNNVETDAAYRARQESELEAAGNGTVEAIRTNLLELNGVVECRVFENTTDVTDADGVPAHNIEAVIWDGQTLDASNQEIFDTLWASKAAGIGTHGSTSGTITDAAGDVHTMKFTRAAQQTIWIDITVKVDPTRFPVGGDTLVKERITAFGNTLKMGDDVVALALRACVLEVNGGVTGVYDATVLELDTANNPSATANIPITTRQIARFDTSRITVTVT